MNAATLSPEYNADQAYDSGRRATSNSPDSVTTHVSDPTQLKRLPIDALPQVAVDLRQDLVDTLTNEGWHFGANLGVVELAAALHYVFESPRGKLVWDTGDAAGISHAVFERLRGRSLADRLCWR